MKYCVMQHALSGWKAIMISGLNFRMAGEIWQALLDPFDGCERLFGGFYRE